MLCEHGAGATCVGAVGTIVPVWRGFPSWRFRRHRGFAVGSAQDRSFALAQGQETRVVQPHVGRRPAPKRNQKVSRCAAVFAFDAHGLALELHQSNGGSRAPSKSPPEIPKGSCDRLLRSQSVARPWARTGRDSECATSVYPRSMWQSTRAARNPLQVTSRSRPVFRASGEARSPRHRKHSGPQ